MSCAALTMLTLWQVMTTGQPGLIWDGTAVHPGCIQELTTDLADPTPVVAAVDLEGCRRSNRFASSAEIDGRVLRWRNPDGEGRGYFQYEYLGVLANGVHVVRVEDSGGGSGVFHSLLFLRTSRRPVLEGGRQRVRHILTVVGSEGLGDRTRATVELKGSEVTIRKRDFRGAEGWGPEQIMRRTIE